MVERARDRRTRARGVAEGRVARASARVGRCHGARILVRRTAAGGFPLTARPTLAMRTCTAEAAVSAEYAVRGFGIVSQEHGPVAVQDSWLWSLWSIYVLSLLRSHGSTPWVRLSEQIQQFRSVCQCEKGLGFREL
jgi:hypothetical protein